MKMSEFALKINAMLTANPKIGEYDVVTSCDDEGNGFNPVYFSPSIGHYEDREFTPKSDDEHGRTENAVCVN